MTKMTTINQRYKKNFGTGWWQESFRHSLASRGIKTRKYQMPIPLWKIKGERKANPRREIVPLRSKSTGKKAPLLKELEFWTEARARLKDDPNFDTASVDEKITNLKEKLKRVQGNPPVMDVHGDTRPELREGVLERFAGRSGKRPDFVKDIEDISTSIEIKPFADIKFSDKERQKILIRERQALDRAIPRIEEKAVKSAVEDKPFDIEISDVVGKRGRPRKFQVNPAFRGSPNKDYGMMEEQLQNIRSSENMRSLKEMRLKSKFRDWMNERNKKR